MKSNIAKIALTLLGVIGIFFGMQQLQAADGVDAMQAQSMIKQGALLLDVREVGEYDEVHAPNATLIPLGELGTRLDEVKAYKDKPIVVTCKSGVRSSKAVRLLQEAGYSRVSNLSGGMDGWEKSGLEVIRKN